MVFYREINIGRGKMFKKFRKFIILIVFTIVIAGCSFESVDTPTITGDNLYVHYIDVGQGDAILIEYNDYHILIDAGENNQGDTVTNYLNSIGVDDIEILIGTHPDSDHIGGLDVVLNNFEVELIVDSGKEHTTQTYNDYIEAIENETLDDSEYIFDSNLSYQLDENIEFEIIEVGDGYEDINDNSVIAKLSYNEIEFLFTGDSGTEIEKLLLDKDIEAEVYKAGHHGSRYSSSMDFLEKVDPEYVIVSAGEDNKYNHPHTEAMDRFLSFTENVYVTATEGTIIVATDGEDITVDKDPTDYESIDNSESENMSFINVPDIVTRGSEVTITVQGEASTLYDIDVYLKSGVSSSSGLEDKMSDENGVVSWTFKLRTNVSIGTYKLEVKNKLTNEKISVYYEIT